MTFKDRLREEIDYQGKLIKEISAEVGISNSTFLSYIDSRNVLPNVETAVKIAGVLNTSVEYLVTGKAPESFQPHNEPTTTHEVRAILNDLNKLESNELKIVKTMIHALAKKTHSSS